MGVCDSKQARETNDSSYVIEEDAEANEYPESPESPETKGRQDDDPAKMLFHNLEAAREEGRTQAIKEAQKELMALHEKDKAHAVQQARDAAWQERAVAEEWMRKAEVLLRQPMHARSTPHSRMPL